MGLTIFSCKELCVEGDFMAQLLIFADDEPAKLLKIRSYRSKILYLYANDDKMQSPMDFGVGKAWI